MNFFAGAYAGYNKFTRHEQVCLMRQRCKRYFPHHRGPIIGEVTHET